MKKISFYMVIILILSFVLVGCSSGSNSMNALKKLSVTYTTPENIVVHTDYTDVGSVVNKFFSDNSNRGFIAEIVPLEYAFYYTIEHDTDTGTFYLRGYAECKCSIKKISQKFNLSAYSDKEISIRQDVFLQPINENAAKEMLEYVGAYKNGSGVEGTYKVPDKFINENDYRLVMKNPTVMLLGKESLYSFITFYDGIPYLSMICGDLNGYKNDIPDDILTSMTNFKEFLETNDSELFD